MGAAGGPSGQIALQDPPFPLRPKQGPLHRIQYVIEFVGNRTVPAAQAQALLSPEWHQALGQPEMWVMAPANPDWRPLAAGDTGSYDSIALSWDILSERGELTNAAAMHLLKTAENFAAQIGRRAMPLPLPQDVETNLRNLQEVVDALDIGVELLVVSRDQMPEQEISVLAQELGLQLGPEGLYEWRVSSWDEPLLYVSPLGGSPAFSNPPRAGARHPGISVGFSVPRSPAPAHVLEGLFHIAEQFRLRFNAHVFDDSDQPFIPSTRSLLTGNLQQATAMMDGAGIPPGSAEARKLF